MAPFRSRDRSNRSGRGQIEHNVLEGLPINQYREVEVTIGPNITDNKKVDKDAWPEPPMPRDSHLLPEHAQQILRAARSGRVYKPPAPPQEDREDLDDEDEHKEVQQGFAVKKWVKVARHLEEPEPEYLAKRRKGLPSQYASANGQNQAHAAPLRETKVQKVDAEGNVTVYKALVPEGQTIEGEIQATDTALAEVAPAAAAPGTVVEGVGVVNAEGVVVANDLVQQTPPRRKPPPPKKKKGGPGRGKKKVVFIEGQTDQGTPASGSDLLSVPAVKQETGSADPSDIDTPMADAGDEDGDGESGDEEGEDREHSPTPAEDATPAIAPAETPSEPLPAIDSEMTVEAEPVQEPTSAIEAPLIESTTPPATTSAAPVEPFNKSDVKSRDPSSSPEMPLSAISHSRQNSINQVPTLSDLGPDSESAPGPVTEAIPAQEAVPEPVQEAVPEPFQAVPVEAIAEAPLEVTADAVAPPSEPILSTEPGPVVIEQTPAAVLESAFVAPEPSPVASEISPVASEPAPVAPEPAPIALEPAPTPEPLPDTEEVALSEGEQDVFGSLEAHLDQQGQ